MKFYLHLLCTICLLCLTLNDTAHCQETKTQTITIKSLQAADLFSAMDDAGKTITIRLYGADAPETGQAHAAAALQWVMVQTQGKSVQYHPLARDNQNHTVARITLPDGQDLATALLQAGLAWADSENAPKDRALKKAMATAIRENKIIWKDSTALAPWDYRKSHNLPLVTYKLEEEPKAESEPVLMEEGEDAKVLKYKGNEAPKVDVDWQAYENLKPQDVMGMAAKAGIAIKGGGVSIGNAGAVPILGQLGIQSGDVVTSVNGLPLKSEGDIMAAVAKLQGSKSIKIQINRGGTSIDIPIPIP